MDNIEKHADDIRENWNKDKSKCPFCGEGTDKIKARILVVTSEVSYECEACEAAWKTSTEFSNVFKIGECSEGTVVAVSNRYGEEPILYKEESIPPRPTRNDLPVIEEVAKKLAPQVAEWGEAQTDEVAGDLVTVLERSWSWDGYDLAHRLDDLRCYDPDSELVEILEHASSYSWAVVKKLVVEWVKTNNVKPKHELGDKVNLNRVPNIKVSSGEVVGVREDTAEYVIFCEELGHKRSGPGTHGIVVPFEQID